SAQGIADFCLNGHTQLCCMVRDTMADALPAHLISDVYHIHFLCTTYFVVRCRHGSRIGVWCRIDRTDGIFVYSRISECHQCAGCTSPSRRLLHPNRIIIVFGHCIVVHTLPQRVWFFVLAESFSGKMGECTSRSSFAGS